MGRQFRFIMDEKDERLFFEYVQLENKIYIEMPFQNPVQIKTFPLKSWFKLYIYNEKFGNLLFRKYSNAKYRIDDISAPVIEFCHTFVRDNEKEIQRGRLWLEMKFWNENEELVQKDSQLEALYKQSVKWIKKNLECVVLSPYGKQVKEYVSKTLVQKVVSGYHLLG